MELLKSFYGFLAVTAPGAILYFLGWVYLHYYLFALGVFDSELQLDVSTVLMYSYTPFSFALGAIWGKFNASVPASVIFAIALALLVSLALSVERLGKRPALAASPSQVVWIRALSVAIITCVIIIVPKFLAGGVQYVAKAKARDFWASASNTSLDAPAYVKEASDLTGHIGMATAKTSPLDTPQNRDLPSLRSNYDQCRDRRALRLFFADHRAYYLLCVAESGAPTGTVFEVDREFGLLSGRQVSQP